MIVVKRRMICLASVPIGLLLASCLRIYPGEVAQRSTWDGRDFRWHHHGERISLIDLVRQGFVYTPTVADGEVRHTRRSLWLWLYLLVIPVCVVASYLLLRGGRWIIPQVGLSFRQLWGSRLRKSLVAYAGLSMIAHVISVHQIAVAASGNPLTTAGVLLALIKEPLELITLPCLFVNHLIISFLTHVNGLVHFNTSPALGLPDVRRYTRIFGPYPFGGPIWESLCTALLVVFWILAVPRIGQLLEQLFRRAKAG